MSHSEGFSFCVRGMRSLGKFLSVEMTSSGLLGTKISLAAVRTNEGGARPEQETEVRAAVQGSRSSAGSRMVRGGGDAAQFEGGLEAESTEHGD